MTMPRQEHLPQTHTNHHADSDFSFQDASCQSRSKLHNLLCNLQVGSFLLNYRV